MGNINLGKTVLFCSTGKLIQNVIKKRLEMEGYRVIVASDGNSAFEMLGEHKPDIMVTEELLPFRSGFELIETGNSFNIPSIIISDTDLENKILEAFDLGAYDFIDKPYSPNELVVRVKNILTHYRA